MMMQDATHKIRNVLLKHGIQPRKQKNFIAELLGLEYISIHQKFSGKRSWSPDQLKTIAKHLNESVSALSDDQSLHKWNAVLRVGDIPQRCLLHYGDELVSVNYENLVAIREDDCWCVIAGSEARERQRCYKVLKLDILPQPRIVALDDNSDITETISAIFGWHGIEVHQFQQVRPMIEKASEEPFDGYILDWMLYKSETVESAIKYVREELESNAPITILTGELRTNEVNQSDIARMVECFDVVVHEKPAVLEILVKSFSKLFFSASSGASA